MRSSPIGAKHICIIGGHKISPQLSQQHPPASPTTSRSLPTAEEGPFSKRLSFASSACGRRRAATPATSATALPRTWAALVASILPPSCAGRKSTTAPGGADAPASSARRRAPGAVVSPLRSARQQAAMTAANRHRYSRSISPPVTLNGIVREGRSKVANLPAESSAAPRSAPDRARPSRSNSS